MVDKTFKQDDLNSGSFGIFSMQSFSFVNKAIVYACN